MGQQFALVDANNFYASCEKAFRPDLAHSPVVVLSNNDGCVVSRSPEAKQAGIQMGTPWFKIKGGAKRRGIHAFSSNYALYGDMSQRIMSVLQDLSPSVEVYSIDEAFMRIERVAHQYGGTLAMGHLVRARIAQWVGLPVCFGAGPTKTLAKLANYLAKKNPVFGGVCDLFSLSREEREGWMRQIPVSEVWGIGRKLEKRLAECGIHTALDLRNTKPAAVRSLFGVVPARTAAELRGIPCLELEEIPPPKQQIMASRSFGKPVPSLGELREAVACFAAGVAEKLRAQKSLAAAVHVFIYTDRFREDLPQYSGNQTLPLAHPSDDTRALTAAALKGLEAIYRSGYGYKKAGVMLGLITPKESIQGALFGDGAHDGRSSRLMRAMDEINHAFGRGTLKLGVAGTQHRWAGRSGSLSPRYTTRWDELPVAG
jgi:DNA polymerase V